MNGIESIAAERQRQISKEGWTPDHDDEHDKGELTLAAAAYCGQAAALMGIAGWKEGAAPPANYAEGHPPRYWPWDLKWWKPKSPREDLVRAGALIAAEIDRIDRAAAASR